MKKLLLLSTLLLLSCGVFGQGKPASDTINTKDSGLHFTPKFGYGRIWESGNGPLYGFVFGADMLYAIKLKTTYLEVGLGGYEFAGNITVNGNTATLRNEYL